MSAIEGTFQYFYCTRSLSGLPHPDVPTRDVTNTQGAGYKTEPHLEKRIENWCRCRAPSIRAAAKRGRRMAAEGGQHYLLLTTRHPHDRCPFVVGVMPFSEKEFGRVLHQHPGRWSDNDFLPYASDERMKLVRFADAFPLSSWMGDEAIHTIPGGQGGRGRVPENLLRQVLKHFSVKPDLTNAFLKNVSALEKHLTETNATEWKEYKSRLPHRGCC